MGPSTDDAPAVNTLVQLRGLDGVERSSRVEDVRAGELVVAAATAVGPLLPVQRAALRGPGSDAYLLSWVCRRGLRQLPVRLVGTEPGPPPLWRLWPAGASRLLQRRDHVRAATVLAAVVAAGLREPVPVLVLDVSEGGLRCSVPPDHAAALAEGPLTVHVTLEGQPHRLLGTAVRVGPVADGRVEVGVRIDPSRVQADAIRRFVFARERAARGVGRDR